MRDNIISYFPLAPGRGLLPRVSGRRVRRTGAARANSALGSHGSQRTVKCDPSTANKLNGFECHLE